MIEYKCNEGKINMKAHGNVYELGADVACLVHKIMHDIDDVQIKSIFADIVQSAIFAGLGITNGKEYIKKVIDTEPEVITNLMNDIREVFADEA